MPAAESQAKRRILAVDDEEKITTALRRSLRSEGYEVVACNDPHQALAMLKAEPFDIVICDHLMPGMNGLELTKLIRDRHPEVLRLMLTGQPDVEMLIRAINHGEVFRFVTKPWDDLELKVMLAFALEHLDDQREQRRVGAVVRRWNSSF
jgi:DNA-binding NtrC family response regulator